MVWFLSGPGACSESSSVRFVEQRLSELFACRQVDCELDPLINSRCYQQTFPIGSADSVWYVSPPQ